MSDNSQDFRIDIKTTADTTGADQAVDAVQKVDAAAKAAGPDLTRKIEVTGADKAVEDIRRVAAEEAKLETGSLEKKIEVTGADKAVEDIRRVAAEEAKFAEQQRIAAHYDSLEGVTGFRDQLAGTFSRDNEAAQQNTIRNLQQMTDKVRVSEIAFYDLDEQVAKTHNTIEKVTAGPISVFPGKMKAGADATRGLGMVATQMGYQVTDFATQVSMGTSAFTAFAQQAPQAIGALQQFGSGLGGLKSMGGMAVGAMLPLTLLTTELAVGIPMVVEAYKKMDAVLKKVAKSEEAFVEQLKFQAAQQRQLMRLTEQERLMDDSKRRADDLDRQVAALTRINDLRAAQSSSASAVAAAGVTIAQNTPGANVAAAKGNALAVDASNQIDALDSAMAQMEAKVLKTTQAAEDAHTLMLEIRNEGDPYSDKYKEAVKKAEELATIASEAQLDLENERAKYDVAAKGIAATTDAGLAVLENEVSTSINQSVSGMTSKAREAMAEVAEKNGGQLHADAKGAMQRLTQIMSDTIPDASQLQAISQAVAQFRGSQDAANTGMVANFDALLAANRTLMGEVSRQKSDISALFQTLQGIINSARR